MMRLLLYRMGSARVPSVVPEDEVKDLPVGSLRGGLAGKAGWLVGNYYAVPKTGPYSDHLRLCPQEQADEVLRLEAEIKALRRQRAVVLQEAWDRASRYRGPAK